MKPGRKLVEMGAANCSDADILAVLIGSGGRGYSAEDVAHNILEKYGTLAALMDQPLKDLTEIRGINSVKAVRLAAVYELACRIVKHLENNG